MAKARESLWEEMFLITYHGNGISFSEVQGMHTQQRKWYLDRIARQKKVEAEAAKKGSSRRNPRK